ncbi:MAG: beta-ketoacyl synthase N-terminal-like domain-containing protein [Desulfobacteraceae bacterium]|jgi:acyl transferase domain-containing protein
MSANKKMMENSPQEAELDGDIAITGMACIYPGAPDIEIYWQNILAKVDAIGDPPKSAWDADIYYDPSSTENDRLYCKRGGYIADLVFFDPIKHGIMPHSVEGGEPDQWLALQVGRDALTDAGYPDLVPEADRTAVIIGKGNYINHGSLSLIQTTLVVDQTLELIKSIYPERSQADMDLLRHEMKRCLPPLNGDTVNGLVPNITASRIANRLDLKGPAYTVDGACASSLLAIDIAAADLNANKIDLALVGGAQVTTPVPILSIFCQLGALSRRQEIRPFDQNHDGTLLAEGIGMIVLKRRADAERDGDRIYAVVKGVGTSSDGRSLGVLAPRPEGQAMAIQSAYDATGISPDSVRLIEAHGTGTPVGDSTEIQSLSAVFGDRKGAVPRCAIGSVKSMIGHCMPAAGIAGVIKTALAIYNKVLPPTINVERPKKDLELEKTPFYINSETRPWIHGYTDHPRRAGVNAFGFGGINAHAILEETSGQSNCIATNDIYHWETEVFVLEAKSRSDLIRRIKSLCTLLKDWKESVSMKDLAGSVNSGRCNHQVQIGFVASSGQNLKEKMEKAMVLLADDKCSSIRNRKGIYFFEKPLYRFGKLAFLFPGEGAQYVNMLSDLCIQFPEVRSSFDRMDQILIGHERGYVPSDYIFPAPQFSADEKKIAEDRILKMDGAVESVLAANDALFNLAGVLGIQPDCLLGHSTGEYSAMAAAGVFNLADDNHNPSPARELNISYGKLDADRKIPSTRLVAVAKDGPYVKELLKEIDAEVFVGMENCRYQTVIVGFGAEMDKVLQRFDGLGLIYQNLPFDRPYHTPLFKEFAEKLRELFSRWHIDRPRIPIYSCTSTAPFPDQVDEIRALVVEHWLQPVKFARTIERMHQDGVRIFLELGPKGNLTTFIGDILKGRDHAAIPANIQRHCGITQMNHMVAELAAQGVPIDFDPLYSRRGLKQIALDGSAIGATDRDKTTSLKKLATGWPAIKISKETSKLMQSSIYRTPSDSNIHEAEPARPSKPQTQSNEIDTAHHNRHKENQGRGSAVAPFASTNVNEKVMTDYLKTMEHFLVVQESVMQTYLSSSRIAVTGNTNGASAIQGAHQHPPGPAAEANDLQMTTASESFEQAQKVKSTVVSDVSREITTVLLELVSEKTGYPTDILDLNFDLEADLGIDSIKRVEILSAFIERCPIASEAAMEQMSQLKKLQQIIDYYNAHKTGKEHTKEAVRFCQPQDRSDLPSQLSREDQADATPCVPDAAITQDNKAMLLELVGEKTGYPPEALDLNLDMEADLGIDSIKRIEIVSAFIEKRPMATEGALEQISQLKTLKQVLDLFEDKITVDNQTGKTGESAQASAHTILPARGRHIDIDLSVYPMIDEITSWSSGDRLEAICRVELDDGRYLKDHTLGGKVSTCDDTLQALPVIPLTLSVEIIAEAGALLMPGKRLVGFRDIRAYRWIAVEDASTTLQVTARKVSGNNSGEVRVQIINLEENQSSSAKPSIEGTAIFADEYPDQPDVPEFSLRASRPSRWTPERLYSQAMFHGPCWQGVSSIDQWGEDGCLATLKVLPATEFFGNGKPTNFTTDPIVLDAAGQVVGFWTMEHMTKNFMVFPYRLKKLDIFQDRRPEHTKITCLARITLKGVQQVSTDLNLVGPDGKLWMRLEAWEDKRFGLPHEAYAFLLSPTKEMVSTKWWASIERSSGNERIVCLRIKELFHGDDEFWVKVFAYLALNKNERSMLQRFKSLMTSQKQWLTERLLAKDAVRTFLKENFEMEVGPVDIEINEAHDGRYAASGLWAKKLPRPVYVEIKMVDGWHVATAIDTDAYQSGGIDAQPCKFANSSIK